MKTIIITILIVTTYFLEAQNTLVFKKASDTLSSTQVIYIPDEVYNENYTDNQNGMAYVYGSHKLSSFTEYQIDGWHIQKQRTTRTLRYEPDQPIIFLDVTTGPVGEKSIAWIPIIVTVLYHAIFLFIFRKKEIEFYKIVVAALVAVGATGVTALTVPLTPSLAVLLTAAIVVALLAATETVDIKHLYTTWIAITLIGMGIIAFFFTSLFLVCALVGILLGYLFSLIFKKQVSLKN
jgi:hypothetical protein